MLRTTAIAALCAAGGQALADAHGADVIELGPRPLYLVDAMQEGPLKERLTQCMGQDPMRTKFSIGHRGAPMQFPEHTVESNVAAARMGAGILECDVTFTADQELVCRHAQDDLHTTTDILATDLAEKCTAGFTPAEGEEEASAECRTSDITLAEFRTLNGKMDAADASATTVEAYLDGTANWRTDLYATTGTLMTHAESIELFDSLGADFTPELKTPVVDMPMDGFAQEDYAQKMIDEYRDAGIDPSRVWPQSFLLEDVLYWVENEPEFGAQAVYLMDEYDIEGYSHMDESTWPNSMQELADMGVNVGSRRRPGCWSPWRTARSCRRRSRSGRTRPGSASSPGRSSAPARSPRAAAGTTPGSRTTSLSAATARCTSTSTRWPRTWAWRASSRTGRRR